MVSGFLTPGGRLKVLDNIINEELLRNPMWGTVNGLSVCDAFWLQEYAKDNYWNGEKMVWHTVQIAIPIFKYAFPDCQALFAFDNASNHCCFAPDALIASNINLHPGGKQPLMRDGFDHFRTLITTMLSEAKQRVQK